jgi:hypothetical protein
MARYQHKDVESILKLFELELSTLNRLSRIEKMKIRKRVANAVLPALAASNSEPDMFLNMVENKLRDVFDLFFDGWGFREKLHKRVDIIIKENKKRLKVPQPTGESS